MTMSSTSRDRYPDHLDSADPLESTRPVIEVVDLLDLRWLRHRVQAALAQSGLPADRAADFVVAVNEVATNALLHGRPPVEVRLWLTPTRYLCAVTDHGPGFDGAAAGFAPAREDLADGGMGLVLARQMSDELTTSVTATGFTVRLAVRA